MNFFQGGHASYQPEMASSSSGGNIENVSLKDPHPTEASSSSADEAVASSASANSGTESNLEISAFPLNEVFEASFFPQLSEGEKVWVGKFRAKASEIVEEHGFVDGLNIGYVADQIGLDISVLRKDVTLTYVLWVELLNALKKSLNSEIDFKYKSVEGFLEAYSDKFVGEKESEKKKLFQEANWMNILFKMISAKKNKGLILDVVTKFIEGWRVKYITGSGQTRATENRVLVYETEGGIKAAPRAAKGLKKEGKRDAIAATDNSAAVGRGGEDLAFGMAADRQLDAFGNRTNVKKAAQAMLALAATAAGEGNDPGQESKRRKLQADAFANMMFPTAAMPPTMPYMNGAMAAAAAAAMANMSSDSAASADRSGTTAAGSAATAAMQKNFPFFPPMMPYPMSYTMPYPFTIHPGAQPVIPPTAAAAPNGAVNSGGYGGFPMPPPVYYYQWLAAMASMGQAIPTGSVSPRNTIAAEVLPPSAATATTAAATEDSKTTRTTANFPSRTDSANSSMEQYSAPYHGANAPIQLYHQQQAQQYQQPSVQQQQYQQQQSKQEMNITSTINSSGKNNKSSSSNGDGDNSGMDGEGAGDISSS